MAAFGLIVGVAVLAVFGILLGNADGLDGATVGKIDGFVVGVAVFAVFGILLGNNDGILPGFNVGSALPNPIG